MLQGLWFGSPSQAVTDVRERMSERLRERKGSFILICATSLRLNPPTQPNLLYDFPLWSAGKYSNVNVPVLALIFKTKGYRVRITLTLHKLESGHFGWHVTIYQHALVFSHIKFVFIIITLIILELDYHFQLKLLIKTTINTENDISHEMYTLKGTISTFVAFATSNMLSICFRFIDHIHFTSTVHIICIHFNHHLYTKLKWKNDLFLLNLLWTLKNVILKNAPNQTKSFLILPKTTYDTVGGTQRSNIFFSCTSSDGTLPAALLLHHLLCTLSSQGPSFAKRAQTRQAGTVPSPAKARRAGTMSPDIPHWQHFTSARAALHRQTKKLIPQVTVF